MTGLLPDTDYEFHLRLESHAGAGREATCRCRTNSRCSSPLNVVSAGASTTYVDLQWCAPEVVGNERTQDRWQLNSEKIIRYEALLSIAEAVAKERKSLLKSQGNSETEGMAQEWCRNLIFTKETRRLGVQMFAIFGAMLRLAALWAAVVAETANDCLAEDAAADAANYMLEHKALKVDKKDDCVVKGRYHYPNMDSKRIVVSNWQHCQSYCRITPMCKFFSYWPDKGCQLQDSEGDFRWVSNKAYSEVLSGPAVCGEEELGAAPGGNSNYLDFSTSYCVQNPTDPCCPCGTCCLPFCSTDHKWSIRDGCPNAAAGYCDVPSAKSSC
ncbi:unnamed protein product [Cladocopium goreaui]|uniref:Apple domain-containing protein n=1 Tax=Cladocopium goreaui TaxID=2562237 RepID=A0A9P1DGD4_9DINO|nr:unnamed protein product [Cladocopium goreaui]